MANEKITELPELLGALDNYVLPIVDITTGVTKKITVANLVAKYLQTLGNITLGDPTANGSWRYVLDGTDLRLETRIGGVWVLKDTSHQSND